MSLRRHLNFSVFGLVLGMLVVATQVSANPPRPKAKVIVVMILNIKKSDSVHLHVRMEVSAPQSPPCNTL
jgi:hypothetical protein